MYLKRKILPAAILVGASTLILSCKESDAPKTPLGAPPAGAGEAGAATRAIAGEARVALDSANALFRAKSYDAALAEYNRAAQLAPTELAPLLGILMVADVRSDTKLANETRLRLGKLDPSYADSAIESHSKIMRAHPTTKPATPRT